MLNLREQLQRCFESIRAAQPEASPYLGICLMGLGNMDYGDDGFGVRLAEALGFTTNPTVNSKWQMANGRWARGDGQIQSGRGPCGRPKPHSKALARDSSGPELPYTVLNAGTEPERLIGRVADGFEHVIFLDAVEFGGAPGEVVFLNADQMAARFPQVSTHKISLGLLAKQVEAHGRTKAWLLGVQPESLKHGEGLSPAVRTTLGLLRELLGDLAMNRTGKIKPKRQNTAALQNAGAQKEHQTFPRSRRAEDSAPYHNLSREVLA